ncbi:hypothetical protein D3C73_639110 [compost metagenome]
MQFAPASTQQPAEVLHLGRVQRLSAGEDILYAGKPCRCAKLFCIFQECTQHGRHKVQRGYLPLLDRLN